MKAEGESIFEGWVILELMGHRKLGGYLREVSIGGAPFIRIDVPAVPEVGGDVTQFYAPAAVYCITPTTEATARALAHANRPTPVQRYELPPAPSAGPCPHGRTDDEACFECEEAADRSSG